MPGLTLGWGLAKALPAGVQAAWGARLIWPADLVHDRQSLEGDDEKLVVLLDWLNSGPITEMRDRLARAANDSPDWHQRSDAELTLFEDERGKIVGSPKASSGYVYVAAWMHEHVV